MRRNVYLLIAGLALAGCGGDSAATAPPIPVVVEKADPAGQWASTNSGSTLNMVLANNNGAITGSGSFIAGTSSVALTITGAYSVSTTTVSLSMAASGFQTMNYTGQFNGLKQLVGTLNGSGFNNTAWIFTKP